ncbi:fuconate dehydratase, partial [Rhizobium leguminosarum]
DDAAVLGPRHCDVVDHRQMLHEHFLDPCLIENAAYMPPTLPGFSIEMKPASISNYTFRG